MTPIMTVEHARAVRHNPDANRTELREALEVLDQAYARSLAEADRVESHALEQARLRALAGTPYAPLGGWSTWGPA